jgi:hypothetical protein
MRLSLVMLALPLFVACHVRADAVGDAGTTPYSVTYAICTTPNGTDGGACFATCDDACRALKPTSVQGTGVCTWQNDEDGGAIATASCEAQLAWQ